MPSTVKAAIGRSWLPAIIIRQPGYFSMYPLSEVLSRCCGKFSIPQLPCGDVGRVADGNRRSTQDQQQGAQNRQRPFHVSKLFYYLRLRKR